MTNKVREITIIVSVLCTINGLFNVTLAAPKTLSNVTTSLTINGGEANNGLVPYNGYFQYTDIAESEETTWFY